ncbi:MAG: DUF5615 family PIN-like protein [Candidatus Poribacteria bacterium]|nr:DUF5615 family PIN-like protein [Candidatus Poribacteria bacterium]
MKFWIDAQLSPALAPWIKNTFAVDAFSVQWLKFQEASDRDIFLAARETEAVVMTKTTISLNCWINLVRYHNSFG